MWIFLALRLNNFGIDERLRAVGIFQRKENKESEGNFDRLC